MSQKIEEIEAIINDEPAKEPTQEDFLKDMQDDVDNLTLVYNRVAGLMGWQSLDSIKVLDYLSQK